MMSITAESDPSRAGQADDHGSTLPDFPIVLIEVAGGGFDSLVVVLQHASACTGVCWILLGADPVGFDLNLLSLPSHRLSEGEDVRVDALSLISASSELMVDGSRWYRSGSDATHAVERGLPAGGRRLGHLLLGSQAAPGGTSLARAVASAGGLTACQHERMVKIFCPGLPDGYVPVPALAPWLARHWLAAPANNARADPIGVDAFQPGSSQSWICLIDAGDRVHRLPDDEVLSLAAAGPGTDLASLMAATHLLVSEAVLAARRSGEIQHLMHLPLDEAGTTKLVDLVFLPLGPATRAKGSVLILASATRKQELHSAGTDDTVPQTDRAASRNAVLAKQLTASRLHLKTAVERLELSNDRLQMAFDDLQRAHTELEAYAADLRALTEELERMNHTHRQKIVELEQLTADMAGLLDSIDVGVVFVDPALRVRRCASVAARMLRLDEPGEGRPLADVAAGLHDEELVSLVRLTLENGDPFEREVACWEASRFLIRVLPHAAADGSVAGAVVTLIDVTAYREAEAGRVQSEERWRRLVDTAPDGILMHEGGVVEMANRSALRILAATSLEHLVGRKLMDLIIPEGRHAVERQLAKAAQEGIVTEPATTAVRTQDGRRVEVEITTATLSEGGRQAFQTVLRDVTERRRAEAEIKRLVHHDRLTGLPNRTLLLDRLETAMARAARDGRHGALMLLDLDQFKDVNDTLGHAAGDRLLQIVARRLRSTLRSTDTLARLGGDEFAIVQTDLSSNAGASGAATLAQKALDSIAEPISVDDHDLFVTCSMGVTLFPIDATSADQLIKNADLALYRAKAEGGQRFQFFLEQMNAEVLHKKSLERDLRRGIERGELSLVFQPQYAVTGGRPVGAEALVRWNHPERGPISPKMFIPVAEATGLIRPLGRWVLEEACRAIRRSIEAGHEIGIGVNLSAAQLRHGDFVGILQSALSDAGIRPELLEIEITESLLFEPSNDAIAEMLRQIAAMGVRLAVDDFGTGYSSLAYLKRFPVHKIKIDQSFVRDIGRDKDDDMIVAAMVSLAHSLGKRAIAEGVETNEQLAFLRKLGCDEVQGYLLARPMPEAALAELLAAG